MPCIMNAANEVAVAAFLEERIGFLQMPDVVKYTMDNTEFSAITDLDSLLVTDSEARNTANSFIDKL
jgi:1-deoxy-D-xylulose-5-phosphate reductoisomerase